MGNSQDEMAVFWVPAAKLSPTVGSNESESGPAVRIQVPYDESLLIQISLCNHAIVSIVASRCTGGSVQQIERDNASPSIGEMVEAERKRRLPMPPNRASSPPGLLGAIPASSLRAASSTVATPGQHYRGNQTWRSCNVHWVVDGPNPEREESRATLAG